MGYLRSHRRAFGAVAAAVSEGGLKGPTEPGARCQVPGARCQVPGARCQVPGARCQVPGAEKCAVSVGKYQLFINYLLN
ncbi:hypothetical protein DY988_29330 [Pseudomonas aeruginosa]|nr:hypothetical protein DY988_29330 [Pseudomonas aeruginosa]